MGDHDVRFAPGSLVSPGMYRNVDTGQVHFFDGHTPLPGGVNSASWQQVSDHYHPLPAEPRPADEPELHPSHPVRFPAGTVVSPGMYRNVDTGRTSFFDGQTPLPGSANAASWQQVSDHYHIRSETEPKAP